MMKSSVAEIQGGSNMTGTDLCLNLAKSVPVTFEPPCILYMYICKQVCRD